MSQPKESSLISNILIIGFTVFGIVGLGALFINLLIAFLLLGLSIACAILFGNTSEGKADTARRQANAVAEKQSLLMLKKKMQSLSQSPNNASLKKDVVSSFGALKKPDALLIREVGLGLLRLYPLESEVKQVVLATASRAIPVVSKPTDFSSQEIYDLCLDLLEQNPSDSKMKALVLELGRWHFGKVRHGSPTIYDEQAIQNDIMVRSK